ncbi:MAG: site-2 protease family protein [Pyrinomonadaceae bacterium]
MSDLNSISNQLFDRREAIRPTLKTWVKHSVLLALTLCTATMAGVLQPFGSIEIFPNVNPQSATEIFQFLLRLPYFYLELIAGIIQRLATHPAELIYGLKFSVSLLTILTAHEAGHYVACRLYGVDATLPFFIPTPPLIGPAGTMGAFIKILSPLPSRRAAFDIGVAGPIAGFLMLIPVAVLGFLTMHNLSPQPQADLTGGIYFSDPLLLKFLASFFGINLSLPIAPNPFYAAAWVGLLVTSLNLIPSGQLDGGHAVYAIFGERIHRWLGKIAFVAMATISILGWFLYNSPSGLLFTILLGVMMRLRHPEPYDDAPLDFKRLIVAILTLLIFALCFVPFPIQIR